MVTLTSPKFRAKEYIKEIPIIFKMEAQFFCNTHSVSRYKISKTFNGERWIQHFTLLHSCINSVSCILICLMHRHFYSLILQRFAFLFIVTTLVHDKVYQFIKYCISFHSNKQQYLNKLLSDRITVKYTHIVYRNLNM